MPAYVVFSDVALRLMARDYPTTDAEFARISGVGEMKRREFGPAFCAEIAAFLREHPKQVFADALQPWHGPAPKPTASGSAHDTWDLYASGKTVAEIASIRRLAKGTVMLHLAEMVAAGKPCDPRHFYSEKEQATMEAGFAIHGLDRLAPVKAALGDAFDYGQLHICRAFVLARQRAEEQRSATAGDELTAR